MGRYLSLIMSQRDVVQTFIFSFKSQWIDIRQLIGSDGSLADLEDSPPLEEQIPEFDFSASPDLTHLISERPEDPETGDKQSGKLRSFLISISEVCIFGKELSLA